MGSGRFGVLPGSCKLSSHLLSQIFVVIIKHQPSTGVSRPLQVHIIIIMVILSLIIIALLLDIAMLSSPSRFGCSQAY